MGEGEKKSFFKSQAFVLILIWTALGIGLSVVVKFMAVPRMQAACGTWYEEGAKELGKPAEAVPAKMSNCKLAEEMAVELEAEGKEIAHPNLVATYYAVTNMPYATAWNIPNFLILLTLLWHFGKDKITASMKTRRRDLEKAIAEAEAAKAAAVAKLAEYEKLLAEIGAEKEKMRAAVRAEAEAEKARLIAEADRQAERIQTETEFTARQELLMAQYRLREEAAKLAVQVAEQVIRQVITGEDRDRILNEYLAKVMENRT